MIAGTCMYIYQRIPGLFGAVLGGVVRVFFGGGGLVGFWFFLNFRVVCSWIVFNLGAGCY